MRAVVSLHAHHTRPFLPKFSPSCIRKLCQQKCSQHSVSGNIWIAHNVHCCLFVWMFLSPLSRGKVSQHLLQFCPILRFSCNQLSLNLFPKEQLQMSFLSHIFNSSIFVIPEATCVHTIFRLCCKHRYSTILKLSICPIQRMQHTMLHD